MPRNNIEKIVLGKKITQINWAEESKELGDKSIMSLMLEDGTLLAFSGSDQIGVDDVWLEIG